MRRAGVWIMAFALLVSAVFAVRIGFRDMLWPVSLPAQLLGIAFFLIGLTGLAGFALGVINSLGALSAASNTAMTLIMAGSFGTAYVDFMIALYSYRYQDIKQYIFIILAALCFALGCLALPKAWGYLSQGLKATGIVITLIVAGIGSWYHNIYIPHNAPVGSIMGLPPSRSPPRAGTHWYRCSSQFAACPPCRCSRWALWSLSAGLATQAAAGGARSLTPWPSSAWSVMLITFPPTRTSASREFLR
jgi:hypothetical protein